ncbi:hypothetical protein NLJ89_g497 [Agrocybe chaxingu]|uniref:Fcf2 pre-rRNA processing C-terminal domain-containing protein n=1 Tax=Agrocybe chaxingu TaxID=84603 RepID=A0A9W8TGF0_9AGAR|nr:hypothetical protein NLJ89_g497 [Agrocybe chaxingu]
MTLSISKGKGKAIDIIQEENPEILEESDSESDSDPTSSSDTSASSEEESDAESNTKITQERLDCLLQKALHKAQAAENQDGDKQEEVIILTDEVPLPRLNPGKLPSPYIKLGEGCDGHSTLRDPAIELAERAAASLLGPAPPVPPPELTSTGKPLTKRERKELKRRTAGPDWFDLPAPAEADLPRLHREVEALRLRNQLDPKRFYKKEEGEGKGIKGLPKYFAIGTILPTTTPFGTASSDNLTRAHRKRTLVDELVDDAEAKRYAKKKFEELQVVRGARGRGTLRAKQALRKGNGSSVPTI